VISARFQCVAMIAILSTGSVQSRENVGATLDTVGLHAESARNYPGVNTGTVPRALSADVKRAGPEPFALLQLVQKSARREDVAIVRHLGFARVAKVGKGKAAKSVLQRRDVGMAPALVPETVCVNPVGGENCVIRPNARNALKATALSQDFAAVELAGLGKGATSVSHILVASTEVAMINLTSAFAILAGRGSCVINQRLQITVLERGLEDAFQWGLSFVWPVGGTDASMMEQAD